jgi:RNA polymerase sigma factor (sigma-70 family)
MALAARHRSLDAKSDEQLAALSAVGDARAFGVLVGRHRAGLLSLARRVVGPERAEDVLQESLLDAWSALRAGTTVGHVRGWLYQIVRHASWKVSRHVTPCELPATLVGADSPEVGAEQSAHVEKVMNEMTRLPAHEQLALMQTAVEGHSTAELAACLGVTEGAARQLVYRARMRLRRACTVLVPAPVLRWLSDRCQRAGQHVAELSGGGAASAGVVVGASKVAAVLATVSVVAIGAHAEIKHLTPPSTPPAGHAVLSRQSLGASTHPSATTSSTVPGHVQIALAAPAAATPAAASTGATNPSPSPAPANTASPGNGGSQASPGGTSPTDAASSASTSPADPTAVDASSTGSAADSSASASDAAPADQGAGTPTDTTPTSDAAPVDTTPVNSTPPADQTASSAPPADQTPPSPDTTPAGSVPPAGGTPSVTGSDTSTTPADTSATTPPSN